MAAISDHLRLFIQMLYKTIVLIRASIILNPRFSFLKDCFYLLTVDFRNPDWGNADWVCCCCRNWVVLWLLDPTVDNHFLIGWLCEHLRHHLPSAHRWFAALPACEPMSIYIIKIFGVVNSIRLLDVNSVLKIQNLKLLGFFQLIDTHLHCQ